MQKGNKYRYGRYFNNKNVMNIYVSCGHSKRPPKIPVDQVNLNLIDLYSKGEYNLERVLLCFKIRSTGGFYRFRSWAE